MKPVKIEKGKKPRTTRSQVDVDFGQLKPGDSFFYAGHRNVPIIRFGYHLAKGQYRTEREVQVDKKTGEQTVGWRFFYLGPDEGQD